MLLVCCSVSASVPVPVSVTAAVSVSETPCVANVLRMWCQCVANVSETPCVRCHTLTHIHTHIHTRNPSYGYRSISLVCTRSPPTHTPPLSLSPSLYLSLSPLSHLPSVFLSLTHTHTHTTQGRRAEPLSGLFLVAKTKWQGAQH